MKNVLFLLCLLFAFTACQRKESYTSVTQTDKIDAEKIYDIRCWATLDGSDYSSDLPDFLKKMGMENPIIDNKKAHIGRMLFYDQALSTSGKTACASCHKQAFGFGDNVQFSVGNDDKTTMRNTPPLANVINIAAHYQEGLTENNPGFLWDERAIDLKDQIKLAFENPREMGSSLAFATEKVNSLNYYQYPIQTFFGKNELSESEVLDCIANFISSLGSSTSRLDEGLAEAQIALDDLEDFQLDTALVLPPPPITVAYYAGTQLADTVILPNLVPKIPTLSVEESYGRILFVNNCTQCHSPIRPAQKVFMANNGLELHYQDRGLQQVTNNSVDIGVFKAPSLRNIALTAPYMHDGRYPTLRSVLDFYSSGVRAHPNLHPLMRQENGSIHLNLFDSEKDAIVQFLRTMNGNNNWDSRFTNPFR